MMRIHFSLLIVAAMAVSGWGAVSVQTENASFTEIAQPVNILIPVTVPAVPNVEVITADSIEPLCGQDLIFELAIITVLQSGCATISVEPRAASSAPLAVVQAPAQPVVTVTQPDAGRMAFNPYELASIPQSSEQAVFTPNIVYGTPDVHAVVARYAQLRETILYTIEVPSRIAETTLVLRC